MARYGMAIMLMTVTGLAGTTPAQAEVRLAVVFGNHMVLQRDMHVPVWGWAEPGETVTVVFGGQTVRVVTDTDGQWMARLAPMPANTVPQDMVVQGGNTVTIEDILVGDVWLCSGQSNMEWGLGACNAPEDVRAANHPLIRHFKVHVNRQAVPVTIPRTSGWQVCLPDNIHWNTAVGYYFARRVHAETGIPIGILNSSVGGSAIEPWIPPEGLNNTSELAAERTAFEQRKRDYAAAMERVLDPLQAWIDQTRNALASGREVSPAPELPANPVFTPGQQVGWHALYNGMIHPLVPFAIKGALWYQGESNGGEYQSYLNKKVALIGSWRTLWGQDFPFYFVQLSNYQAPNDNPAGGDGWARIRTAQTRTMADVPHTGMAVTIDIGEAKDIHPRNKFDVGERLALWALAKDYGQVDLVYSGPLFRNSGVEENSIRITFEPHSVGSGLMAGAKDGRELAVEAEGDALRRFAIAGEDKQWHWADARIDGPTVVVSSPIVPAPVAVRYAYAMNPEGANLYNKEGLPAAPFRTDDW